MPAHATSRLSATIRPRAISLRPRDDPHAAPPQLFEKLVFAKAASERTGLARMSMPSATVAVVARSAAASAIVSRAPADARGWLRFRRSHSWPSPRRPRRSPTASGDRPPARGGDWPPAPRPAAGPAAAPRSARRGAKRAATPRRQRDSQPMARRMSCFARKSSSRPSLSLNHTEKEFPPAGPAAGARRGGGASRRRPRSGPAPARPRCWKAARSGGAG